MKGRKPKPTRLKEIQGNPGKRPLNGDEPRYELLANGDISQPPIWLDDLAAVMWTEYAPQLARNKILTDVDVHNLQGFCVAYSNWRKAQAAIECEGITVRDDRGAIKKNPACTVSVENQKLMIAYGALLGLDPSSRTRLQAPRDAPATNPFAALLEGRASET